MRNLLAGATGTIGRAVAAKRAGDTGAGSRAAIQPGAESRRQARGRGGPPE
jgi:hypothetical protein